MGCDVFWFLLKPGALNQTPDDRVFVFKKLLCVCEGREGTVEDVCPDEQRRHLFLKVAFGPRTGIVDRAVRLVMIGAARAGLVGDVKRRICVAMCGAIHAIDDQLASFVRSHTETHSILTESKIPEVGWEESSKWPEDLLK